MGTVMITYTPLVQDTGGAFYVTANASQYHPGSERLVKRCKKM